MKRQALLRHHDVSDLHFDGDEMILTIDGSLGVTHGKRAARLA